MPIPVEQNPMVRTTARERVYKTLREWIINGVLLPDERLNDVELAHHFTVSRTPVREALQMLAEQKLVTMIPSSGTYVAPIDQNDMRYVYELLGGLQSFSIELIIDGIHAEDLDRLHSINEVFYRYALENDAIKAIHADWDLHHLLAERTENPYIISYTEQLMTQAHRNEIQFFKNYSAPKESYQAHSRIIQALQDHNLEDAILTIKQNWQISIR